MLGFGGWCMTNKDFNHVLDTESKPRWYTVRYEPTAPGTGDSKNWTRIRHNVMCRWGFYGLKAEASKGFAFALNIENSGFTAQLNKAYMLGKNWCFERQIE